MDNRFANIFNLTEDQAIALLKKPIDETEGAAERYVAASHLISFPSPRTIQALIEAVEDRHPHQDQRLARRKAIESLGRLKATAALPTIVACLGDRDPYTVENAVWAIGEIGTDDEVTLESIANLLTKPEQSYRTIIQTLAKLNYQPSLTKIEAFIDAEDKSIASSAIAAAARLYKDNSQVPSIVEFLQHDSVNVRRASIQDLIDLQYYPAIPQIAKCPTSIAFRLRGIKLLAMAGLSAGEIIFADVEPSLDLVIRDRPQDIILVHEYDQKPAIEFLIRELYHTDFGRCYLACQTLLTEYADEAPAALMQTYEAEAYNDYGGHFHVVKLLGLLEYQPSYELLVTALNYKAPQFQKSRGAAAIALANLGATQAIPLLLENLQTPIFDLKYACLLALEQLGETSGWALVRDDRDLLIRAKAEQKI
ncbi:HEAT repeat domain-containing protein [Myxosarcina sp. GI1]|uniref:HEAT repeat domain-containing protein n=1 Tax=Myxosarcina sp. GI1 TaxID=1541065 RepID=UPI00056630D4|nr:HEAT repeat domain-containing protein [Myxosarcina sp. GI1]